MILDGNSLGKASGWGLDLSVLVAPFETLKMGMVVRDVTDTKVEYEDGGSEVIAPIASELSLPAFANATKEQGAAEG